MPQYDNIIIGAGHNGLVCAAYLAKKGQSVLVLEASDTLGGLAATREFYPGYKIAVAHSLSHFSPQIVSDLNLTDHGFKSGAPMPTIGLDLQGKHVVVTRDTVRGVTDKDASSYTDYLQLLERFANMLSPFWLKTMPRIGSKKLKDLTTFAQLGLKLRLLGKEDMGEFMRVATLPARDLMDENFDNDLLKAVLSWDGLIGSKMAPRSPNATVLAMLYRMSGEHNGASSIPQGGIESLINALHQVIATAGGQVQRHSPVAKINVQGDSNGLQATGVELADGTVLTAGRVISSADPKRTFLQLVGVENLEIEFSNRINRLRSDGYVAKLHLALDGLPHFNGIDIPDGRMIIAPKMDSIEFAFDNAKYGESPEQPVMEMMLPSLRDASLAPEGKHLLSAHIMYVPHSLKGGWTAQAKASLQELVIDTIAQYAPELRQQIIHAELLTPEDIERSHHVTGGHWHHTELSMDQMLMMRPTYEAAQYSTPIPGLFLCGAGSHPGGGLMGGPGHNAARHILGAK
ncbi:MAG: NAD(P)/FAD-dependent oxidoreductase [Porticoccaceae bacterium]|nr:NAD(P)/FAD-dependent oxidoreductase [Porticoccaceae bacterium]